jgi:hypothetical protein
MDFPAREVRTIAGDVVPTLIGSIDVVSRVALPVLRIDEHHLVALNDEVVDVTDLPRKLHRVEHIHVREQRSKPLQFDGDTLLAVDSSAPCPLIQIVRGDQRRAGGSKYAQAIEGDDIPVVVVYDLRCCGSLRTLAQLVIALVRPVNRSRLSEILRAAPSSLPKE